MSYEGTLNHHLPVFIKVIVIIIASHFIWLAVLYGIAGLYTKKKSMAGVKALWSGLFNGCGYNVIGSNTGCGITVGKEK
ncbi:MAG: hypothetical protein LUD02_10445 [Tannerellaceae bacterium]|nr:hypothetical protein [Tannerellaceae bacterium]